MKRGRLIVIDGSDGVGKATQTRLLAAHLRRAGKKVSTIAFAQYKLNLVGKLIRECLDGAHGDFVTLDAHIISVLFAADRFESKALIEKWLKSGRYVIADRYVSANMIHQGGKIRDSENRRKFLKWIEKLEYEVFKIPRPDITLYLDLPAKLARTLLSGRGRQDRADKSLSYQKNAQESALDIIKRGGKWHRITSSDGKTILSRGVVHQRIWEVLKRSRVV